MQNRQGNCLKSHYDLLIATATFKVKDMRTQTDFCH